MASLILKLQLFWDIFDPSQVGHYRRISRPIDGWLTRGEEALLFRLARQVDPAFCIVELGSWFGRSAIMLAGGSRVGGRASIYAVDLFQPAGCAKEFLQQRAGQAASDFLDHFRSNMERAGVADLVTPVRSETAALGKTWQGPPVGLLFLDADHSYQGVSGDWASWEHRLAPQAKVAFHDYQNSDYEVTRFVDELIEQGRLRSVTQHDSILCAEVSHARPAR